MTAPGRTARDWIPLLVLAYGAVVFVPMLRNGFILDDFTLIANAIATPRHPELLLGLPHRDFRPLVSLLFLLNLALSGLNPAGYYVVNLILHLANVALVMRLTREFTGSRNVAWIAGALFAGTYGSYGDAIAWISGRTGPLADLFMLGSVITYGSFVESGRSRDYALALMCFTLALLSKETAVALLPLLALTAWARGVDARSLLQPRTLRPLAPFAFLFAVYLTFQFGVVRRGSAVIGREYFLGPHMFANLAEYLARMVVPLNASSYMVSLPAAWRAPLQLGQTVLAVIMPLGWAVLLMTRATLGQVRGVVDGAEPPARHVLHHPHQHALPIQPVDGYCMLVAGFLAWWWEKARHSTHVIMRSLPVLAVSVFLINRGSKRRAARSGCARCSRRPAVHRPAEAASSSSALHSFAHPRHHQVDLVVAGVEVRGEP